MANRVLNVATLGCSRNGRIHAENRATRIPHARMVVAAGRRPPGAHGFADVTGVPAARPLPSVWEHYPEACVIAVRTSVDAGWQAHTPPAPGWDGLQPLITGLVVPRSLRKRRLVKRPEMA